MFTIFLVSLFMFTTIEEIFSKIHYLLNDKRLLYLCVYIYIYILNKINNSFYVFDFFSFISKFLFENRIFFETIVKKNLSIYLYIYYNPKFHISKVLPYLSTLALSLN